MNRLSKYENVDLIITVITVNKDINIIFLVKSLLIIIPMLICSC